MLGVSGAGVAVFHVSKSTFHLGDIAQLGQALDFIEHRRGLRRLVALPILVAIPGREHAQRRDQDPGDQVAVLFPNVLELVELFLFFEIELICHGVGSIRSAIVGCAPTHSGRPAGASAALRFHHAVPSR